MNTIAFSQIRVDLAVLKNNNKMSKKKLHVRPDLLEESFARTEGFEKRIRIDPTKMSLFIQLYSHAILLNLLNLLSRHSPQFC